MNAFKITVFIIDHDEIGPKDIKDVIENTRYPNRCIDPKVKAIECRDIGEWHDDHPLNSYSLEKEEYERLFGKE